MLVFALPAGVFFLILESKDIIKWKMLIKKLILHSFTDLFRYNELNLNFYKFFTSVFRQSMFILGFKSSNDTMIGSKLCLLHNLCYV